MERGRQAILFFLFVAAACTPAAATPVQQTSALQSDCLQAILASSDPLGLAARFMRAPWEADASLLPVACVDLWGYESTTSAFKNTRQRFIVELTGKAALSRQKELEELGFKGDDLADALDTYHAAIDAQHTQFIADLGVLAPKAVVRHDYRYAFNGLGIQVDDGSIEGVEGLAGVARVHPVRAMQILLNESVDAINASAVWGLQNASGANITGTGVSIAIIDTGVDETHPDIGNCSVIARDNRIDEYLLESPHPYNNSQYLNWTITQQGYANISVHFVNISVETNYDKVYIKNASGAIKQTFTGDYTDVWTTPLSGDTLIVSLVSDYIITDWGFVINATSNGSSYDVVNCTRNITGFDFYNNDSDPSDNHGHGTHCAGIAAGNGILKGVAPDATLYAYKVLSSSGSGTSDDIIAAIERAMDPNQDNDTGDHVDVISMSLGGAGTPDDPLSRAVDAAVDAGVVVVVAAGNSGPTAETIGCPGCARKALTVGASCLPSQNGTEYCNDGTTPEIATFSSRGPAYMYQKPDVIAPGVRICAAQWTDAYNDSQCLDNDHIALSGTSMATPHVAGAAALLLQAHPDWSPQEVKAALENTAASYNYTYAIEGAGRIDALAAVQRSQGPPVAYIGDIVGVRYE